MEERFLVYSRVAPASFTRAKGVPNGQNQSERIGEKEVVRIGEKRTS